MLTVHPETVPAKIVAIGAGVVDGVGEGEEENTLLGVVELRGVVMSVVDGTVGGPHEPLAQYTLRRRLDPISGSQIRVLSVEVMDQG